MEADFVDRKAVQVKNLFLYSSRGFPLYKSEVEAMKANESNTVFVDLLQSAIADEYLRFEASLQNACKRFVIEQNPSHPTKSNLRKNMGNLYRFTKCSCISK